MCSPALTKDSQRTLMQNFTTTTSQSAAFSPLMLSGIDVLGLDSSSLSQGQKIVPRQKAGKSCISPCKFPLYQDLQFSMLIVQCLKTVAFFMSFNVCVCESVCVSVCTCICVRGDVLLFPIVGLVWYQLLHHSQVEVTLCVWILKQTISRKDVPNKSCYAFAIYFFKLL